MKSKVTEIFDAVARADNIKDVDDVLMRSAELTKDEQNTFLTCLRDEFSKISVERKNGFKLSHVHPLNKDDLSQGFHIGYRKGG